MLFWFYIQLSTVDHYGNEHSCSIIASRHEQWQHIESQLSIIKSFPLSLLLANVEPCPRPYAHRRGRVSRFVHENERMRRGEAGRQRERERENNSSCDHLYFVASAGQKSLYNIDVSSKWMIDWSWMGFDMYKRRYVYVYMYVWRRQIKCSRGAKRKEINSFRWLHTQKRAGEGKTKNRMLLMMMMSTI